ncbi:MAG: tetratricopeptide repeat protein [Myxococcota bacterium]
MNWIRALVVALLWLLAPPANAQESAEALFRDALAKMKEGRFAEACPLLERSHALEAKSGTLISLGFCRERIGQSASAWRAYREATTLAQSEGRDDYRDKAQAMVANLEPSLSRYEVMAPSTPGLEIQIDGRPLPRASWGTPVEVDPGRLVVVARAPNRETWTEYVDIRSVGTTTIEVPDLVLIETTTPPSTVPGRPDESTSALTGVGWALVGVGGASAVVGFVFGGLVLDRKSVAEAECDDVARTCTQAGLDARSDGRSFSVGSTVGVVAGLALAGAGVTLVVVGANDGAERADDEMAFTLTPRAGGALLGAEVAF